MAYQVLARKYRPQSFAEVIGQEPVVQTLQNAVSNNRLHHAYLFCGARGIGKTSLARILAKSLNCAKGLTTEPCQECSSCKSITQGNSIDVLEMDGASNTSVDHVRELREQAKYLPTSGKYKIYIIDEVHMLSNSAFNALLKIIEEPPPHLIFMLATTEVQDIPATILSRCLRFDLKRLNVPGLSTHLKNILAREGLSLDEESLSLVAQCADGSIRDALSLLDQVLSFCGADISAEKIRGLLGLSDKNLVLEVLEAVLSSKPDAALEGIGSAYDKGLDLKMFAESLLQMLRHALMVAESGSKFVNLSPAEIERLSAVAKLTTSAHLISLFQILNRALPDLAYSSFPRMVMEVTALKMIHAAELLSVPEILEQLSQTSPTLTRQTSQTSQTGQANSNRQVPAERSAFGQTWPAFVQKVRQAAPSVGAMLEHGKLLSLENSVATLIFESIHAELIKEKIAGIEKMALDFFGRKINLQLAPSNAAARGPSVREIREQEEKKQKDDLTREALANPAVKLAQDLLGAKVKEVREIK